MLSCRCTLRAADSPLESLVVFCCTQSNVHLLGVAGGLKTVLVFQTVSANVLIGGTGALHVPSIPDFKGKESFQGESFHSAQWRRACALTGKTVAIIGTGASAVQVVPAIANQVRVDCRYVYFSKEHGEFTDMDLFLVRMCGEITVNAHFCR